MGNFNFDYSQGMANPYSEELAFDLRLIYARIVGIHLIDIIKSRRARDYATWFRNLRSLKIVISHKMKKKSLQDFEKEYKEIFDKVIEKINENKTVYFKKSFNPMGIEKIESALFEMEELLWYYMDESNMMGSKRVVESLM